jgi:hypothetical protein
MRAEATNGYEAVEFPVGESSMILVAHKDGTGKNHLLDLDYPRTPKVPCSKLPVFHAVPATGGSLCGHCARYAGRRRA